MGNKVIVNICGLGYYKSTSLQVNQYQNPEAFLNLKKTKVLLELMLQRAEKLNCNAVIVVSGDNSQSVALENYLKESSSVRSVPGLLTISQHLSDHLQDTDTSQKPNFYFSPTLLGDFSIKTTGDCKPGREFEKMCLEEEDRKSRWMLNLGTKKIPIIYHIAHAIAHAIAHNSALKGEDSEIILDFFDTPATIEDIGGDESQHLLKKLLPSNVKLNLYSLGSSLDPSSDPQLTLTGENDEVDNYCHHTAQMLAMRQTKEYGKRTLEECIEDFDKFQKEYTDFSKKMSQPNPQQLKKLNNMPMLATQLPFSSEAFSTWQPFLTRLKTFYKKEKISEALIPVYRLDDEKGGLYQPDLPWSRSISTLRLKLLKLELSRFKAVNTTLSKERIPALEGQIAALEGQIIPTLKGQIAALEGQIAALEGQIIPALEGQIAVLEEEQLKHLTLQGDHKELQQQYETLKQQHEELMAESTKRDGALLNVIELYRQSADCLVSLGDAFKFRGQETSRNMFTKSEVMRETSFLGKSSNHIQESLRNLKASWKIVMIELILARGWIEIKSITKSVTLIGGVIKNSKYEELINFLLGDGKWFTISEGDTGKLEDILLNFSGADCNKSGVVPRDALLRIAASTTPPPPSLFHPPGGGDTSQKEVESSSSRKQAQAASLN